MVPSTKLDFADMHGEYTFALGTPALSRYGGLLVE